MTHQPDMENLKAELENAGSPLAQGNLLVKILESYHRASLPVLETYLPQLINAAQKSDSDLLYAWTFYYEGILHRLQENHQASLKMHLKAMPLFKKTNEEPGLAMCLNNAGLACKAVGRYEDALNYYFEGLTFFEKLGDKYGYASAHNNIGVVYYLLGRYQKALENMSLSLHLREEMGDKSGIAASHGNIGCVYMAQGKYPEALSHQLITLKLAEELEDISLISTSRDNIGTIYVEKEQYSEALENYFAAIQLNERQKDKAGMARINTHIGIAYEKQGLFSLALERNFMALELFRQLEDEWWMGICYLNIGNIYGEESRYPEALQNYFDALEIKSKIGDKSGMAFCYANIGAIYLKQADYPKAGTVLIKALDLAIEVAGLPVIKDIYFSLHNLHKATGDYQAALKYYELFTEIERKINSEESAKKIASLEFEHQLEKKEKELEIEKLRNMQFETQLDKMRLSTIRGQLEPHFIGNNLTLIRAYIRDAPEIAEQYLTKFSRFIYFVLGSYREDSICLEDELAVMRDYLDLEVLRRSGDFEYQINLDEDVEADELELPPLMLQPLIENAIKHGVKKAGNKIGLNLHIYLENGLLICSLENEIAAHTDVGNKPAPDRKSYGLQIITDRLEILSKEKGKQGFIEMIPENGMMKVKLGIPI